MAKINLQLFAKLNTKESIVDYLKSEGKDSSMSARKELAKEYGISNYSGTYDQNVALLKAVKSGSNTSASAKPTTATPKAKTPKATAPTTAPTTKAEPTANTVKGVDQSLTDKINSTFTASDKAQDRQDAADAYLGKVQEMANVTDIIDQSTWDALNTQWNGGSSAYKEAYAYTQGLLEQLSTGRTSYTDQIKDMMAQIQNREDFQYDISTDTMFQQALGNAMVSGQTAMQDTIGQASALTGGYASTYATSAGNQAYNAYIQDAYNNLPQYYQMALEAYQMEGDEMYRQLEMLTNADATEFGRLYDSWQANFTTTQNMYDQEYGAWRDSVNNAYNSANLQLNEYGQLFDQAYSAYTATQNSADSLYAHEFQNWQAEVDQAMFLYEGQQKDYWSTQDLLETQRQHDETLAQRKDEFNQEMAYKNNALAQDQAQFEASQKQNNDHFMLSNYDYNGDGMVDEKDTEYKAQMEEKAKTSNIDQKYFTGALEAYNKGGTTELNKYLNSLNYSLDESSIEALADYAGEYGEYVDPNDASNPVAYTERKYTVERDGGGYIGKLNDDAVVKDQYGNKITIEQLYSELQKEGMSAKKAKEWLVELQKELGI